MKIAIYGGTFNPIHIGHTALLKSLKDNNICDRIIVLVAGNPPHKNGGIADEIHRLNMVKIALENEENITVSDIEIGKSEKSYTYNTMKLLKELYKDDDLWFVVGADSFKDLPVWYEGEKLIKENKFIAVNREGAFEDIKYREKFDEIKEKYNAVVEVIDVKTPDVSSSGLRESLEKGEDVSDFLPDGVYQYILNNNLYAG